MQISKSFTFSLDLIFLFQILIAQKKSLKQWRYCRCKTECCRKNCDLESCKTRRFEREETMPHSRILLPENLLRRDFRACVVDVLSGFAVCFAETIGVGLVLCREEGASALWRGWSSKLIRETLHILLRISRDITQGQIYIYRQHQNRQCQ